MADDVIDTAILSHVVEREAGALAAFQEPSLIEHVDKVTLCTYDELQELWFNDHDICRPIVAVRPQKFFLQKMISAQNRSCDSFRVYLTFPDSLTEFEYSIRIHDLFGDHIGFINYAEKIGVVLQDVDADKSIALFLVNINIELRMKRSTFNMILQPIQGILDLVMPKKVVKDLNVLESLRTLSNVFKIVVAKRNGCFRHHEPDDVVSVRILCSSTSLEEQKEILNILQPSFDILGRSAIKECQFRNGVPWRDEDF